MLEKKMSRLATAIQSPQTDRAFGSPGGELMPCLPLKRRAAWVDRFSLMLSVPTIRTAFYLGKLFSARFLPTGQGSKGRELRWNFDGIRGKTADTTLRSKYSRKATGGTRQCSNPLTTRLYLREGTVMTPTKYRPFSQWERSILG